MKDLRIIFMGTPDFALATLKKLVTTKCNIAAVVTAADRPAGRGRKIQSSVVKTFAKSNNIPVLQPFNLKSEYFLKKLYSFKADLQIVVAFRMLPKVVWNMPPLGTFNVHASLLPNYRGAAPIHHCIINGEKKTGVTTFFLDEKIDTGAIILQKETLIKDDETLGELYNRLMNLGSDLCIDTLKLFDKKENIRTIPQSEKNNFKIAHKLSTEFCKIDWQTPIDNLYNKIRGLNPSPGSWCFLKNDKNFTKVKIFDVEKQYTHHNNELGSIFCNKKILKTFVNGGVIVIKTLQISGKKRMNVKDLCNGFEFYEGAKLL